MIYPYTIPLILTDSIFTAYGGLAENSQPTQRQAAFLIAEIAASEDLGTFLLPTIVTGTFQYRQYQPIILDHTYVRQVYVTWLLDREEDVYYTITGTSNLYVSLKNMDRGLVDLDYLILNCGASLPYSVRMSYQAGLPTGTASRPDVLLALTTYADIVLHEVLGFGNESAGDIGVQKFESQEYREERVKLIRTAFGTSARAQFVSRLLTDLRKHQYVGL